MKVFSTLFAIFMLCASQAQAQAMLTKPPAGRLQTGVPHQIRASATDIVAKRGVVRCGTNLKIPSYAHQEDNVWHGIDVDFCRVIAQAVVGDREKIEMVHVSSSNVTKALNSGYIDVMLSGVPYSAKMETERYVFGVGPLYYDNQQIMIRGNGSQDLADYKDKKVCLSSDAGYLRAFDEYNTKHNFGIKYLTFSNLDKALEAFYLKRCSLLSADSLMLQGIKKNMPKLEANLLPMKIATHPMYALVKYDNLDFQLALKWIFNALFAAEEYGIKGLNLGFYATNDEPELRNLFGDDPEMWRGLHVQPNWLREVINSLGNYNDIYERNIGMESEYQIPREANKLMRNGGTVLPIPFM